MNRQERILALEAALIACEGYIPSEHTKQLLAWVNAEIDNDPGLKDFGELLDAQREAVKKLAASPEVFGA